jgi:N-acylneuraminate cytidylyltransferase/CMP-N,N'-diacetyllegionaminic acid synthase
LIEYPIQLAKLCSFITRVLVTTDTPEIQKAAIQAGADAPFLRPAELATDTAKQEDAILHTMDWCEARGQHYDYLCLLCSDTPLARFETLNKAFDLLTSRSDAEAVFAVVACDFSPLRCNTLRPDGLMKDWQEDRYKWLGRQEMPKYYRLSGLITISTWEAFRREKTFLHDKTLSMIVDPVEAVDINTPYDFFIAQSLLEKGFRKSNQVGEYVKKS